MILGMKSTLRWLIVACFVVTPGCGRIMHKITGGGGKSSGRTGTLTVTPPSGAAGSPFTLSAGGFLPSEAMTFEIDPPNKTHFVGPAHTAGPDGKVSSTYTPSTVNPSGTYTVKAVGVRGTRATAQFTVTGGGATTSSSSP
jgi:hypothetical protein